MPQKLLPPSLGLARPKDLSLSAAPLESSLPSQLKGYSFSISFLASQTSNFVVFHFFLCYTSGASSIEPIDATGKLYILLTSDSLGAFFNQLAKEPREKGREKKEKRTHFYNCSSQFSKYRAFVAWCKNG